jgi:hypothetical protein
MDLAERKDSFFILTAPPAVWAAHFALSYATASIWCAKATDLDAAIHPVRIAIAAYSGLALAVVALIAVPRLGREAAPASPSKDTALDRHRFLRSATVLLCGLTTIAIVFEALVVVFVETCR